MPKIDTGDTAFVLLSAALVLLMTPGLAFFYGGLVRRKNALNTMMMSFVAMGLVGIVWILVGYTLAFAKGPEGLDRFIGGFSALGLRGVERGHRGAGLKHPVEHVEIVLRRPHRHVEVEAVELGHAEVEDHLHGERPGSRPRLALEPRGIGAQERDGIADIDLELLGKPPADCDAVAGIPAIPVAQDRAAMKQLQLLDRGE